MWMHVGGRVKNGGLRVTPLRGIIAAVRWCSAAPSSRGGQAREPSPEVLTVKGLHRQAELLARFEPRLIRNFSIIAHIDHGKSTLADCLLVETGTISAKDSKGSPQMLDTLKVERERGITVKAQTASMLHDGHLLNLIDTPGHVDFSYEVVRSLSACQGALLLVDASQGVQAQTLSTAKAAQAAGLKLLPVVTKIDLPHANVEEAILSLAATFDLDPDDVIPTSAKTGEGIQEASSATKTNPFRILVLTAIVERVPPPPREVDRSVPLRARLVDSWFDPIRGVVCLVEVVDGCLLEQDRIVPYHLASGAGGQGSGGGGAGGGSSTETFSVQEVGLLTPGPTRTGALYPGQVGYMIAGMRSTRQATMGDTIMRAGLSGANPPPLAVIEPSKSMLFASVYPLDDGDFESLLRAVERLALNDAAIKWEREHSLALGMGLRMGFLGVLHMEVFHQRLVDEFDTPVLLTTPTVPYQIQPSGGREPFTVVNLSDWPDVSSKDGSKFKVLEPIVDATIITPCDSLGSILTLLKNRRGHQTSLKYLDDGRVLLEYKLPWQEVVSDLHDQQAKTLSSGYASFDYSAAPPEPADLVKVDIAINGDPVDALSFICHREAAQSRGRDVAKRLKEVIDRQQFEVVVHAKMGAKPFAKERIAPYRKDVLTKSGKTVGGGDPSRKKKLLEKQKKGKARAKTVGRVQLSQEAFWAVLGGAGR
ncbi:unnamed protein product [Ascophyllum nodosum]